jgi:hypothetical protein
VKQVFISSSWSESLLKRDLAFFAPPVPPGQVKRLYACGLVGAMKKEHRASKNQRIPTPASTVQVICQHNDSKV